MDINLSFGRLPEITMELIISEPGGKVLLDTIAPGNVIIKAELATNQKLVDVTTVYWDGYDFYATTIKSVDPSKWVNTTAAPYRLPDAPNNGNSDGGNIFYTNFPSLGFSNYVVSNMINKTDFGLDNNEIARTVTAYYQSYNGNNVYLLLPDLALYNFHKPAGAKDTVDLSHMDTAMRVTFNMNPGLTPDVVSLNAIFDSTRTAQGVSFFPRFTNVQGADLVYPPASKIAVQKYELEVGVYDPPAFMTFYSYDRTVPTSLRYPVTSDYTISSREKNNFTLKYNSSYKPTYYTIRWLHAGGTWTINVPADSTTIDPSLLPLYNGTKLYKSSLADMQFQGFETETVAGFTYADFWDYTCNPATVQTGKIKTVFNYLINN